MVKKIVLMLICINIFLSLRWLFTGNLLFHSDLARDFILMQDLRDNQHLTLIGPRSGGISGVFHGPLWLYINMPFYLLGRGNPIMVSLGWWLFHIITIIIIKTIGSKLYGPKIGTFSALLYSAVGILDIHSMNNPNGATIIFPIFFYYLSQFLKTKKIKFLLISWLLSGLLIQFQMAFGGPILLLTIALIFILSIKYKKTSWLVSLVVLLLPISTFIVFDLRHDWLQLHSVLNFLNTKNSSSQLPNLLFFRIKGFFLDGLLPIAKIKVVNLIIIILLFAKAKKSLFFYFYLGFWFLAFFFHGQITAWYYAPFASMAVIVLTNLLLNSKQKNFLTFFWLGLYILSFRVGLIDSLQYPKQISNIWSTWTDVQKAAKMSRELCGNNFGYFVYTPDLYGYELVYPMHYLNPEKAVTLNTKKEITCLILAPNVKEHPNGRENWISGDIRIYKKPAEIVNLEKGISIQKYTLTPEEQIVAVNPNMVTGLFFR